MTRLAPPRRARFSHFAPVTLRWNDCDAQGHVNNSVPFQLFDTVVSFWQIDNGLFHAPGQPICVVAREACDFFAEIAMRDEVVVGLAVARLGTSSIAYELGLFVGDHDAAAVRGEFVHVVVDSLTRRATPIPQAARAVLAGLTVLP